MSDQKNCDKILEEARGLNDRLHRIEGSATPPTIEEAMEKAAITVRLAELWPLWQDADWAMFVGANVED